MKFNITKAEYDALSDEQKALYTAKGDSFQMKIEGLPDIDGMQSKLDTLLNEAKTAKEAKKQSDAEKAAAAEKAARASGDLETLEKSYQDKFAKQQAEHQAAVQRYQGQVGKLMVGDVANSVAAKLFGKNAGIMLPHVTKRLSLEEGENGEFKTRILDKDGKPSASTLEDLEKEFSSNQDYASVLVTTQAKGPTGGTTGAPVIKPEPGKAGQLDNRAIALAAAQGIAKD